MSKSLKKVWNVVSSILVALVVILALLLVGARVAGLQVFTVLSGSMEPTYHTGSLIYVKKVDPYAIQEGQPITFMLDENTVATHRVVGIVPDEEDPTVIRFRTKGDANEAEDGSLVHYKNVIGTPIFSIPYLGYIADYIQHERDGLSFFYGVGVYLLYIDQRTGVIGRLHRAGQHGEYLQSNDSRANQQERQKHHQRDQDAADHIPDFLERVIHKASFLSSSSKTSALTFGTTKL